MANVRRRRGILLKSSKMKELADSRKLQASVTARMREIWIDGYGLLPYPAEPGAINQIRRAMRELVADDRYWDGLEKLGWLKMQVQTMLTLLKTPHVERSKADVKHTTKPRPKH